MSTTSRPSPFSPDDIARRLDRDVVEVLGPLLTEFGVVSAESLASFRTFMAPAPYTPTGQVTITEHTVPASEGGPALTLRVHRPNQATSADGSMDALPAMVWMHGGGLVMGMASGDDARFDNWCTALKFISICVEYRLAPETPYPGPIEDCYRALAYVSTHADEFGVDSARIGIGGPSAGGGLAASLGLMARDRGEVEVAFQLLIYPMIDDRRANASHSWPVPIWPPASNTFGWTSYLGNAVGTEGVSPYAAAARATDLCGLPPTLIVVGALDGFVEEDIQYAHRLIVAGVDTELHVYPGAPHGFESLARKSAIAHQANNDIKNWLQKQLA